MGRAPQVVGITRGRHHGETTLHFHNGRQKKVWWSLGAIQQMRTILERDPRE